MRPLFEAGSLPQRITRGSIERPALVAALWAALALAGGWLALDLSIDTSTGSILHTAGSEWALYEDAVAEFGSDEVLVVAAPLSSLDAPKVVAIHERLASLGGVARVESLASLEVPSRDGDAVRIESTIQPGRSLEVSAKLALESQFANNSTVSSDATVVAWVVFPEVRLEHYDQLVESVIAVAPPTAWVSGVPAYRSESNRVTRSELRRLMPLALLTLLVVGRIVLRRYPTALLALTPGAISALLVGGCMAAVGVAATFMTMVLPPILLALGVAYAVHPIVAARSGDTVSAEAVVRRADGVALSGLTTALGLLSAAAIPIPAVRELGTFGALGVITAAACALTLVPALALRASTSDGAWKPSVFMNTEPIAVWSRRRPRLVVATWLLLFVIGLVGLSRVVVDTDATRWFGSESRLTRDYFAINEQLSGISPINVVVSRVDGGSILGEEDREAIGAFVSFLRARAEVGHSVSVVDVLQELGSAFGGEGVGGFDQLLLLAEGEPEYQSLVSRDQLKANIPIRVLDNSSTALLALASDAESWWSERPEYSAHATGIMYEFARAEDAIAWGQAASLGLAILVVGSVLLVVLRSPSQFGVALAANCCPVIMVVGAMGLLGLPMDAATVVLGALAIGIAVDDTLHLALEYARSRSHGSTHVAAIDRAFREVAPAISATTAVLVAGFAILATSEFVLVSQLGVLTVIAAAVCWLADLTLLPAGLELRKPSDA